MGARERFGDACRLTDLLVQQHAESTGVHRSKFAQIIDDRVDNDPKGTLLVVLFVSSIREAQAATSIPWRLRLGSARGGRLFG